MRFFQKYSKICPIDQSNIHQFKKEVDWDILSYLFV